MHPSWGWPLFTLLDLIIVFILLWRQGTHPTVSRIWLHTCLSEFHSKCYMQILSASFWAVFQLVLWSKHNRVGWGLEMYDNSGSLMWDTTSATRQAANTSSWWPGTMVHLLIVQGRQNRNTHTACMHIHQFWKNWLFKSYSPKCSSDNKPNPILMDFAKWDSSNTHLIQIILFVLLI